MFADVLVGRKEGRWIRLRDSVEMREVNFDNNSTWPGDLRCSRVRNRGWAGTHKLTEFGCWAIEVQSKFHWRHLKSNFGGFEKREGTPKQFCQSTSELPATGLLRMWPCKACSNFTLPRAFHLTPLPLPTPPLLWFSHPLFADKRAIQMFTLTAQQPNPNASSQFTPMHDTTTISIHNAAMYL